MTRFGMKLLMGLVVLGLGGYLGLQLWFHSYLQSEAFKKRVEHATSNALHASALFDAFTFSQGSISSHRLVALGRADAGFERLQADSIRAEFDPWSAIWRGARIDRATIDRLTIALGPNRPGEASGDAGSSVSSAVTPEQPAARSGQVRLRNLDVQELGLLWPGGDLQGATGSATLQEDLDTYAIQLARGVLHHSGFPDANLERATLRYRREALFIDNAVMNTGSNGKVTLNGEVQFGRNLDLQAEIQEVPAGPLLQGDWRYRLSGDLQGRVRLQRELGGEQPVLLSGSLQLLHGKLVALPVLDQIALFTQTAQFRSLNLSDTRAEFSQDASGGLVLSNVQLESAGLLRIRGACTIRNGQIDGTFHVGVSPATLAYLPASRDRVFNQTQDGYVCTDVRVSGPLDSPKEDLSPRLAAAMQEEVIGGAGRVIRGAADQAIDLLKPFLR